MENDTPTRMKLREARFFLGHLREIEARSKYLDREDFDFYLNAFLTACRSVTFVLQAEFGNNVAYRAWFDPWIESRSNADKILLEFMNAQRLTVIHVEGTAERERVVELIEEPWSSGAGSSGYQHAAGFSYMAMGFERGRIEVARHYFKIGDGRRPVVEVCGAATQLVREVVEAFYAQFPLKPQ